MQRNDEIQDLLVRYAAEVGRYLPSRGRSDIKREIVATLADTLEDRVASRGGVPTIEDAVALLRETGHPRTMAASYLPNTHVIGPGLYPVFALVCRIALPVLGVLVFAALVFSATLGRGSPVWFGQQILSILGSTASAVLQSFGLIVLVFLLIERLDPNLKASPKPDAWDPRRLPKAHAGADIRLSDHLLSVAFNVLFLAVLLFLPERIPVISTPGGSTMTILSLSADFRRLVPLLAALCGIEILAALFLMTRRAHTLATRIIDFSVKGIAVASLAVVLSVWPYVVRSAESGAAAAAAFPVDLAIEVLNKVIRGGCVLGIVLTCVDAGRALFQMARSHWETGAAA